MSSDEESDSRETEGEKALKKRREQKVEVTSGLDDNDQDLLQQNQVERDQMMAEINELRQRSERRKQEREIEEKRLAKERAAEEARRKAEEEERKRKKEEEEQKKYRDRMLKMAEFEKWKNPPKANYVISKKLAAASGEDDDQAEGKGRKSKEQLEAEKKAILKQRIKTLDIAGADKARLAEKLRELHNLIARLEGEKYDLEKRYKTMQGQLQQLAELARQANKVGRDELRRVNTGADDSDKFKERFAGAPSKVEMFSKYERQKDKRTYEDRKFLYTGPQYLYPPDRIKPNKVVGWNEEGVPIYTSEGQAVN